jgi:hypothetical protein
LNFSSCLCSVSVSNIFIDFSLSVSGNRLSGSIPMELGSIPSNIQRYVNLKGNNFIGSIPTEVIQNPRIALLNVQANSLSGFLTSSSIQVGDLLCSSNSLFGATALSTQSICFPFDSLVCGDGIRSTSETCSLQNTTCCSDLVIPRVLFNGNCQQTLFIFFGAMLMDLVQLCICSDWCGRL